MKEEAARCCLRAFAASRAGNIFPKQGDFSLELRYTIHSLYRIQEENTLEQAA